MDDRIDDAIGHLKTCIDRYNWSISDRPRHLVTTSGTCIRPTCIEGPRFEYQALTILNEAQLKAELKEKVIEDLANIRLFLAPCNSPTIILCYLSGLPLSWQRNLAQRLFSSRSVNDHSPPVLSPQIVAT